MRFWPEGSNSVLGTIAALCLLATVNSNVAWAQRLPGSTEPGRLPQQFQPAPRPLQTPETVSPEIPETVGPALAERIKFVLRQIVIEGARVYTEAQLEPLYADLLNETVSLADMYRVADAITTKYRSDGYILSRAVVPAQRIADGVVRIRVVEGFINRVIFQGIEDTALKRYGDRIVQSHPLLASDLERYLLLMNDLPGVSVRGVMAPAQGVLGGSDLTVIVDRKNQDATLSLDNRGSKFTGPLELISQVGFNNPFGNSDRLAFQYITTPANEEELRYFQLDYTIPIGGDGTTFQLSASGNESLPGSTLQTDFLRTETSGQRVIGRFSHPFIRSRVQNLVVDLSFGFSNSIADQFSLPSVTRLVSSYEDRIRAVRAGVSYDTTDSWAGRDFARLELSQGVPIFNSTVDGALTDVSRPGGRTTFTKGTLDASRLQSLDTITSGLNFLVATSAGWSFGQSLLASEQFGVGGGQFGRGYDPSELTGDYGAAGKVELQYNFRPDFIQVDDTSRLPNLQLFTFYDYGVVADQNPELLNEPHRARSIASTGFGVRASWLSNFTASLEVDKSLTRRVSAFADSKDTNPFRIYFTLVGRY